MDRVFTRLFGDPLQMARRGVGSACTVLRALGVVPTFLPNNELFRLAFPSGLFSLWSALELLGPVLPAGWPDRKLYLCACDLARRERVVFGTPGAPQCTVAEAVAASCAIPGFYEPAVIGGREYVDGGVLSTTHLDLAAGHDLVIGVAPMSYDRNSARPSLRPARLAMEIYRRYPSRTLRSEMAAVREGGSTVLVVRPTVFEARRHGFNLMDRSDRAKVAAKAYKTMAQSLSAGRFAATLPEFGYRVDGARADRATVT
jgi:NTE family protein